MQVPEGVPQRPVQCQLLELIKDHCLSQVVKIPTRNDRTLDLLFANSPSPVGRVGGCPRSTGRIVAWSVLGVVLGRSGSSRPRGGFVSVGGGYGRSPWPSGAI